VVGFTIGSRGKVPGKTCERRIRNNNNNNNTPTLSRLFNLQSIYRMTSGYFLRNVQLRPKLYNELQPRKPKNKDFLGNFRIEDDLSSPALNKYSASHYPALLSLEFTEWPE
jgi:hypothetical protein